MRSFNYLIVEDHPFQRSMLEQLVRGLGAATVHSAVDGDDAMRVLRDPAVHIDIVISDVIMPEVDGIELLPTLRRAFPRAALVLVSADANLLAAAQAIAQAHGIVVLGAVEKPLTAAELEALVRRYSSGSPRA